VYVTEHLKHYRDLYLIILSWPALGFILPSAVVLAWSVFSFVLILRQGDFTSIFLAFVATLLFSDSYLLPLAFAATAKIVMVVLLLGYVVTNYKEFSAFDNRVFKYFLPFLIFALLASLWSVDIFNSFQKSLSYGIVFFVMPLFFQKARSSNDYFGKDLVIGYALFLLAGILLWLINPEAGTLVGRYRGLMGNPNGMGTLLTVLAMLVFILYQQSVELKKMERLSWLFFFVVFVANLLLCGSRTALFSILIFLLFTRLRYFTNFGTLIIFALLIASYNFILTNLPTIIVSLGLEDYLRSDTLEEGSGRFIAWNFAMEQIPNKLYLGGGFGYTEYLYKSYMTYLSQLGHQGNAHNSYLTLTLDTGIIGIILFLIGLVRTMVVSAGNFFYALPVFYAALFSANFESWLAASLNPFTSLLLITLTIVTQPSSVETAENESVKVSN